ncbi:MAG: hypothetical protein OEL77_01130 [Nitrosopumilus sp.]|nr:hypothetical protein [Nitrosopumilus sp.]MDH3384600.1 hypothetical protein [Nitrosopumilus sp.]
MKTFDECSNNKGEELNNLFTNREIEIFCSRLSNEPKIIVCITVDSMARSVACGFKENVQLLNNQDLRQILCMASLELSTKRELDNTLRNVNLITTYRNNVTLITIHCNKIIFYQCH